MRQIIKRTKVKMKKLRFVGFLGLFAVLFWIPVAQTQVTTATISGTIRDETAAVLPRADVTVRNVETGVTRTVATDERGRYQAPNLSLGNYEVQVRLTGFQSAVRSGITLTVGQEAALHQYSWFLAPFK